MAHLLGVVGTDVPEADLREAMSPHVVSKISRVPTAGKSLNDQRVGPIILAEESRNFENELV